MDEFEFETAIEARKVLGAMGDRMYKSECTRFKRDLWTLYENISGMISELSSIEVKARQTKNPRKIPDQRKKIQDAMVYLDKLILIQILMQ